MAHRARILDPVHLVSILQSAAHHPAGSTAGPWLELAVAARYRAHQRGEDGHRVRAAGVSFTVMLVGARLVGGGQGSPFWPLSCTLLLTIGELYLSPVGLSLVTKVAPVRMVSMLMGVWLLASFFGNFLSGRHRGPLHALVHRCVLPALDLARTRRRFGDLGLQPPAQGRHRGARGANGVTVRARAYKLK